MKIPTLPLWFLDLRFVGPGVVCAALASVGFGVSAVVALSRGDVTSSLYGFLELGVLFAGYMVGQACERLKWITGSESKEEAELRQELVRKPIA